MERRTRARSAWIFVASVLVLSACASSGGWAHQPVVPAAAPVPAPHQSLYNSLSSGLDAYQAMVDHMPAAPANAATPLAAAELLPANGNRLTQLLAPTTMLAVDQWLDRFKAIGVGGVTLGIKVPMLLPEFGPNGPAYATFFATVADHARARGLTVDVELGALFCGTVFANCSYTFSGSYQDFVAATVAQARIVMDHVRPTYITVLAEPTTQATLSGVKEFSTPAGSARYVHDVLSGIGPRGSTKIGAGAAAWLSPSYNQAILAEPIDYLTVHIYPMNAQIAETLRQDTALARAKGVPIMADEVGLYKTDGGDPTSAATADQVFRLDDFSFFEPLDHRFLAITAQWAKKAGGPYVSLYWAGQLFAYLDWTPQLDAASYPVLTQAFNAEVARAFAAGALTDIGRSWPRSFAPDGCASVRRA